MNVYTMEEVGERLKISKERVRKLIKAGTLAKMPFGSKTIRVSETELIRLMNESVSPARTAESADSEASNV